MEKRHCTLCFWLLERRKLKPLIKDKSRGDAYGCVYDTQPECAEGLVPSRTLLGALYILPRVSNLFVLLRWLPRAKMEDGQQEIPSFFSVCGSEIEHL